MIRAAGFENQPVQRICLFPRAVGRLLVLPLSGERMIMADDSRIHGGMYEHLFVAPYS